MDVLQTHYCSVTHMFHSVPEKLLYKIRLDIYATNLFTFDFAKDVFVLSGIYLC